MDNRLGKEHWLNAARRALLHHGPDGVRVELLAKELGVTKGSFYWHFEDRNALLEALLQEWEQETALLHDALRAADPRTVLSTLIEGYYRLSQLSERGDSPSDAAIFAWAAIDPKVARRANRAEKERMELFRKLTGQPALADLFFYAYHGYLLRRRRVPEATADLDSLMKLAKEMLMPKARKATTRRIGRAAMGLLAALTLAQGCTTYRIIRYREPSPDRQVRIFPQRAVRHADAPFTFAKRPRPGLDTVTVRDVDGQLKPLASYLEARSIRAFLVIRDDTIVYEKYREGYDSSTLSSSFSAAKSVTSSLLGAALGQGKIQSLDDPVTKYIPELAKNRDYDGVTIRHLLGMRSGFHYTRTNGSPWHDLRSSDAHFYHTTDLHGSLAGMRRETPPGTQWAYKDSDTETIGWILANATGKSVAQQTEDLIWKRIGTQFDASWDLDHSNGREKVSSGLNATARDYARFGRLILDEGRWAGEQILPRDWVVASTTLDTSRAEPEVVTWYRMQHQQYWWIPMQNWANERDFFADGSRGQRIYVHRPTRTIIVQLADDSNQEFPFRKIVHALSGEPFRYPTSIPAQLLRAARSGATPDSLRALFDDLSRREKAEPALWVNNEAGMIAVGQQLAADPATRAAGIAVLELSVKRSPGSARSRAALDAARIKGNGPADQSADPADARQAGRGAAAG